MTGDGMTELVNGKPRTLRGCSVMPPMESIEPRQASTPKGKKNGKSKGTADRFGTINQFVDFTLGSLPRNEAAVWLILWRDTKNGTARTAQADIARRANIARRTVIRNIHTLEGKGLLQTVHQGGLNRGMSVYRVLPLAKPP